MPSNRPLVQSYSLGYVEVSPRVVAALAARAAAECYGIVGMAARGIGDGLAELLNRENAERGIELRLEDGALVVDLYVIVEHGVRVIDAAHHLMAAVESSLEQQLGIRVREINVNVQGVRRPEVTRDEG